jgi:hypothetical protein
MCAFAASRSPARVARAAIVPLLVAAAALGEAGCATDNNTYNAGAPATVAYARPVSGGVEIEDDGLPSQAPPAANIRQMPDDPSEPYSRNYGGPNPAAIDNKPIDKAVSAPLPARAAIPADLPPAFRRQLAMAGYVTE